MTTQGTRTEPFKICVLILAAGRGERFRAHDGKCHKLVARLAGKQVLQFVLDTVEKTGLASHVVTPVAHESGMGDSIRRGVEATPWADGWLVVPADLPLMAVESIQRVAKLLPDWDIVVPFDGQQKGHPVGFSRHCHDALLALTGDEGARRVISTWRQTHPSRIYSLALNDPGIRLDIDTPSDLYKAVAIMLSKARYQRVTAPLLTYPRPWTC